MDKVPNDVEAGGALQVALIQWPSQPAPSSPDCWSTASGDQFRPVRGAVVRSG
ncbi:hypothetical protein [Rhizobium binxianense]